MKAFLNYTRILRVPIIILLALVAVLVGAHLYGAYRWKAGTQELRARLDAVLTAAGSGR